MSFYLIRNLVKLNNTCLKKEVRNYARWAHRTPRKVLTEQEFEISHKNQNLEQNDYSNVIELSKINLKKEIKPHKVIKPKFLDGENIFDFDDLDKKTYFESEPEEKSKKSIKKAKKKQKLAKEDILDTTFDKDGNFVYNKLADNDPKIGQLMLMVKSKKLRDKKNRILLEGKRIICDALEVKCNIEHLMFNRKSDLEYFRDLLPKTGVIIYKMAYKDIQMWSDLTTTPGVMAIVEMPDLENVKDLETVLPITIICDNIREPGNLGAILRTSVAVGCEKVILTKGCVDLWDPKVLRSASGAHFRLKIQKRVDWSTIEEQVDQNSSIFLADNKVLQKINTNIPILPYYTVDFGDSNNLVLIIGGETEGISKEAYKLALNLNGIRLNVPLSNNVDSLNTGSALAVIIFEMKKQFLTKK